MKCHKLKMIVGLGALALCSLGAVQASDSQIIRGQNFTSYSGNVGVIEDVSLGSRTVVIDGESFYLPSASVVMLLDEWGKPYKASMRKLESGTMVKIERREGGKLGSITEVRPAKVEQ